MLSKHWTYYLSGAARHLACRFGLKWKDAAKGLLDHVDCIGFAGGYRFAVLVGNGGDRSAGRSELVGGVPQRLVLGSCIRTLGSKYSLVISGSSASLLLPVFVPCIARLPARNRYNIL